MKTIYKVTYSLFKDNIALTAYVDDRELAEKIAHKRNISSFGEEDGEIEEISISQGFDELPRLLRESIAGQIQQELDLQ